MFLRTEGKIGNDYPEKVEWCGPWEVVHGGVWGATAPHSTCHFYCQPCFWTTMLCYINFVLYYKVLVNKNEKRNFFFNGRDWVSCDKRKDFCISLYTSISVCQTFFTEFYRGNLAWGII